MCGRLVGWSAGGGGVVCLSFPPNSINSHTYTYMNTRQVVMGVGKFNRIDVKNAMSLEEEQQAAAAAQGAQQQQEVSS